MSEKMKVGIYLKEESKQNLDRLKEFNRKINPTLDKLFSFNKEGLLEYIKLLSLYQDKEEWEVRTNGIVCTTSKEQIQKSKTVSHMSIDAINEMILDSKLPLLAKGETEETNNSNLLERMVKLTRATEYLIKHEKKHDREIGKLERRIFELEES